MINFKVQLRQRGFYNSLFRITCPPRSPSRETQFLHEVSLTSPSHTDFSIFDLMLIESTIFFFFNIYCFIERNVLLFPLYKSYASNILQTTREWEPTVPFLYSLQSPLIHLKIVFSPLQHAQHCVRNQESKSDKNRCFKFQWKIEFKGQQALIK